MAGIRVQMIPALPSSLLTFLMAGFLQQGFTTCSSSGAFPYATPVKASRNISVAAYGLRPSFVSSVADLGILLYVG